MAAGSLALLVLLVSGCTTAGAQAGATTPAPAPVSTPAISATPAGSDDAAAFTSAESNLKKFYTVRNQIAHDGGADPERLRPYASANAYEVTESQFGALRQQHLRYTGKAELRGVRFKGTDGQYLLAYVCDDLSRTSIVDASGAVRRSPDPDEATPYEIRMVQENGRWVFDAVSVVGGNPGNACG